jgi:hypothetical protein
MDEARIENGVKPGEDGGLRIEDGKVASSWALSSILAAQILGAPGASAVQFFAVLRA